MKDMKFMKVKHSLSLKEEAPNLISLAERRASHPNPVSSYSSWKIVILRRASVEGATLSAPSGARIFGGVEG
jgi:hypothetical protein